MNMTQIVAALEKLTKETIRETASAKRSLEMSRETLKLKSANKATESALVLNAQHCLHLYVLRLSGFMQCANLIDQVSLPSNDYIPFINALHAAEVAFKAGNEVSRELGALSVELSKAA